MTPDRRRLFVWVTVCYLVALAVAAGCGWLWRDGPALWVGFAADVAATAVVFGFSLACNNSSVYDPYWSVAPIPLVAYWLWRSPAPTGRGVAVLVLVGVWGVRLTYNCLQRWRSLSQEDFRYLEIRSKAGKWYWPASFISIHLLPTLWVFGGLLSAHRAATSVRAWGLFDALGLGLTAAAIALEWISDRQLRTFLRTRTNPEERLATGLWAWSRHPNYLGEIGFWWGLYLLGLGAEPALSWLILGPLAISCLFVFVSVPWMDRRLAERHPLQAAGQKQIPALLPGARWG